MLDWSKNRFASSRPVSEMHRVMLTPRPFPQTSPTLLETLRAGGRESSWRKFFGRYAPAVFRAARLRGLGADDADDVVQQVMTSICAHISEFEYDRTRGQFRQWVRRIAENRIASMHRRRRPVSCDPQALTAYADEAPSPDELWAQQWEIQDMQYCLEQLAADVSPRQMEAFKLYALEGASARDTAEAVGMTIGSVYVTRNQLLNMLRERMKALSAGNDGEAGEDWT